MTDSREGSASPIFRGDPAAEDARRRAEAQISAPAEPRRLERSVLRDICLAAGASDVGFIEIDRPGLGEESAHARKLFPAVRTVVALVLRTNRDNLVAPSRPMANNEWHHATDELGDVAARVVRALSDHGVRGAFPAVGFPMDMDNWTQIRIWELSHKIVAVEAGMGHMGIHRNVIHPRFGNFVLLESLLIDAELDGYDQPLDYNPCLGCNLCVAVCPVGAIDPHGEFDFFACLTHNYREFLGGFSDLVDTIADAPDATTYRTKMRESETISVWQSLGFGPQYKSGYCMAVCPAGDEVIGLYNQSPGAYRETTVKPLLRKDEPVYVRDGSRAERVARRNPNKDVRYIDFRAGLATTDNFVRGIKHMFTPTAGAAANPVRLHLRFSGEGGRDITVAVLDGELTIEDGHVGVADATITGPEHRWLGLLNRAIAGGGIGDLAGLDVAGDPSTVTAFLTCLR
jgi:epoxyqueuosine reductase QueG